MDRPRVLPLRAHPDRLGWIPDPHAAAELHGQPLARCLGGFDIGLGVALVVTAVAVVRRSPYAEVAAAISGTLLVCDAWFDLLTSRTTSALVQAALEAALVELPLAALCFWMAVNLARAVEVARPFLRAAGFKIEDNRLRPPEDSSGS